MPVTMQAAKKLRSDRKRTKKNIPIRMTLRRNIKDMRKHPTHSLLKKVFRSIDKAAKIRIIHPNKAARLKSRLLHLIAK